MTWIVAFVCGFILGNLGGFLLVCVLSKKTLTDMGEANSLLLDELEQQRETIEWYSRQLKSQLRTPDARGIVAATARASKGASGA
jgi:hypothetical protein